MQKAARELGIDSSRITKWRQNHKRPTQLASPATEQNEEQKLIKRIQEELKDGHFERDILKKAVGIFSRGDEKYSDL